MVTIANGPSMLYNLSGPMMHSINGLGELGGVALLLYDTGFPADFRIFLKMFNQEWHENVDWLFNPNLGKLCKF